ncbi:MAG TPA: hypothetical protein VGN00_00030 [Puia sp.]|jgi:hypothetical protein
MKYFVLLYLAGAIFLTACGNHQPTADTSKQDSLSQTDSGRDAYFPVAEFLETEILHVDSVPLALRRYRTFDGKTDSAFIQVPEFNQLALQFLPTELHNGNFEKNFTESSFADQSTQSIMFTYSTKVSDQSLRRVDVQTVTGNGHQKVKSIYLEKRRTSGDSLILEKMYWRTGSNFQIVTMTAVKGKPPVERQLKVVWDDEE